MLIQTFKTLVLLQSLKYTSQIQPYLANYWGTTYVTDKVPDYWNHGEIHVPGLLQRKKPDIFPAWLTKATTVSSSQVTETSHIEDYDIEIVKTSTDKVFTINEIDNEIEGPTSVDQAPGSTSMPETERTNTIPSITTRTAETDTNLIIIDIFTTIAPTSAKSYFTHPEFETTIDDFEAHPTFTTTNTSVITSLATKPNYIITDSIYATAKTPGKNEFTRPEFETTTYDDDAHSFSTNMASTTPYETTLDYAAHPTSTRMTQQSTPEYDTTIYNDEQPESMTMALPSTPYATTFDYASMTQQSSTPVYNDDEQPEFLTMAPSSSPFATTFDYASMTQHTSTPDDTTTTTVQTPSEAEREPVIRANRDTTTDPFSVFLRKLMIILSVKRLEDLPLLLNQFREYVWILLKDGRIGKMGLFINSYIARRVMALDEMPVKSVRNMFSLFQRMLAKRYKVLSEDVNDIIDYMDDTYDEAEEEAMQAVLYEAGLFPNSRNNNKIAQGFVDYVFLNPMQRVMGTTRGDVLFDMMTKAVKKREIFVQKQKDVPVNKESRKNFNLGKLRRQLRELSDVSSDEHTLNESYKRKYYGERKSDGSSDISKIKTPGETNENSDETESDNEPKENYAFKINENIVAKYGTKHAFANVNQVTTRNRNTRQPLSKLGTSRYSVKTKQRILDVEIQRPHPRTRTTNSAEFLEITESRNIEMELKAKIYDTFRRMNSVNYNASRSMRDMNTTIHVQDDSQGTDVERVLKKNIYKAVKKLLKN